MSLTTVQRYREPHAAHVARCLLESHQIPAFVNHEHHVGLNWPISNALGGVKLQVPPEYYEEARGLLGKDHRLELDLLENELPAPAPVDLCPDCHSENIQVAQEAQRVKALSFLLTIPFKYRSHAWFCKDCGHSWEIENKNWSFWSALAQGAALLFWSLEYLLNLIPSLFKPQVYYCWSCGHPYLNRDQHCEECGTHQPDIVAYSRYVRPETTYDGACGFCHTPYRRQDYVGGGGSPLCAYCQRPLLFG